MLECEAIKFKTNPHGVWECVVFGFCAHSHANHIILSTTLASMGPKRTSRRRGTRSNPTSPEGPTPDGANVEAIPPIKEESIEASLNTVSGASRSSGPKSGSGSIPVGESTLSHPLLSLIESLPSPPLPASALPSPPSQRFVAALTRLVGESNIDPAFPIATQPAHYLEALAKATPSRSAILYGTVINETLLNRAGPDISPGALYRCLLSHFPTNETLWTKYLVEATRMNRDIFAQLCSMLGVSATTKVRSAR